MPADDAPVAIRRVATSLVVAAMLLAEPATRGAAEDAQARYLIYLHGRIVQEQQSARPRHPQFGYYELEAIKKALREQGFVVSADIRPKEASLSASADVVVEQVRRLLGTGVPADRITVVGASMGGVIAMMASARLQNPDLRFCILGGCLHEGARQILKGEGKGLSGHVLSIREASDDLGGPCAAWNVEVESRPPLVGREIVLHTGKSHGFLYQPLAEWVRPTVAWAGAPRG
jgi:dienelactone hydrolase